MWESCDALIPVLLKVEIIEAARILKDHIIGLDDLLQLLVLVLSIGLEDSLAGICVCGRARPSSSHYGLVRL